MTTDLKTKYYMFAVIALGFFCFAGAVVSLPAQKIDVHLIFLFLFTVLIASRVSIEFPKVKSHIAVSDTFVALGLLVYGGEIAVVLAAVEALMSSWRFCNKKITVFFNFSAMAISTLLVVVTLELFGFDATKTGDFYSYSLDSFFAALSIIAIVQFLANTSLAAVYGALKSKKPIWETWKSDYLWTFVTYFVGAFSAGAIYQASTIFGSIVILASVPVIFLVYLSYRMYMKNITMSMMQAEQAEKHAEILESQARALRESEERFRSAFDYAPIGIALVSPVGDWLKVNKALCDILGYTEEEFLQSDFQSMLCRDNLGATLTKIHELVSGKISNCQMEQRYLHKNNKTVWASWSVSRVIDSNTDYPNLIFQIQDITDKKHAQEKLQYEATHDALTGLPNRAFFLQQLENALDSVRSDRRYKVCVLFIDLDRFKVINDSLGHFFGDQLLIEIASRLRDCLRPDDLVARLGGDEFTILVEGSFKPEEVISIAERIQEKFSEPFNLGGHEVYSSASIGILHNTINHKSAEDMMRDADTAMYQAKRAGKARHEIFDENMHEEAKAILELENDLRRVVERDEFTVFYQPIYSLEGTQIQGFEALARWSHPEHGFISPEKFIALAEEIGLIDALGFQILRKACRQGLVLKSFFPLDAPFTISVNVSCKQFANPQFVGEIRSVLTETGFAPENLKLEITESVFIEHKEKAVEMLHQLREIGVEINIDDFGSGYSNLSYLMQLPISTLKIDRSFINPINVNGRNLEIIQTILTLAQSLGIKIVAEGVEDASQLDQLRSLNCEGAQGYFFAKPMSFEKMTEFLENKNMSVTNIPSGYDEVPIVSLVQ
ncbi:MAG: EAL domain-containing protein [Pyrinomonadaceae bacterium]|nr:EAL domain-containing protein [Pyrinomonadaceae bacterium]